MEGDFEAGYLIMHQERHCNMSVLLPYLWLIYIVHIELFYNFLIILITLDSVSTIIYRKH